MNATTQAIAQATLDGFNRHYALFRDCARAAKRHFEAGNWLAIAHISRDRIDFYDRRVAETVARLEREFGCANIDEARWEQVKRHYIGLLIDHRQPECAETFFNSVSCKILQRTYFHNRCLFVRPAISTEHIDADPPSYRSYYPRQHGLRHALIDIVLDFRLERRFARLSPRSRAICWQRSAHSFRDHFGWKPTTRSRCCRACSSATGPPTSSAASSTAISCIRSWCRSSTTADGRLYVDALLLDREEIALLFSANRAYFLVDMEVPSAYVTFLRTDRARSQRSRALHDGRTAEARQDAFLPRFPASPQALDRRLHHRARHQGAGDDGVHAAVVSVRVQGDPRQDRSCRRTPRARRSRKSTCWSSTTTASVAWRIRSNIPMWHSRARASRLSLSPSSRRSRRR